MKDGVGIINAARGGVINEVELVSAIENGKFHLQDLIHLKMNQNLKFNY